MAPMRTVKKKYSSDWTSSDVTGPGVSTEAVPEKAEDHVRTGATFTVDILKQT